MEKTILWLQNRGHPGSIAYLPVRVKCGKVPSCTRLGNAGKGGAASFRLEAALLVGFLAQEFRKNWTKIPSSGSRKDFHREVQALFSSLCGMRNHFLHFQVVQFPSVACPAIESCTSIHPCPPFGLTYQTGSEASTGLTKTFRPASWTSRLDPLEDVDF